MDDTPLAGRKVFVYAGNMGVAQGMDILLDLAERLRPRTDVGFLFVGRGSDAARLKAAAQARGLTNAAFFDEIDPDEIPDLYAQCSAGIVALDPRHKSHNIPGKFLTYMQSGLPVLANVNRGNDLAALIRGEEVGQVCERNEVDELVRLAEALLAQVDADPALPGRCRQLFARQFSAEQAVRQIVGALGVAGGDAANNDKATVRTRPAPMALDEQEPAAPKGFAADIEAVFEGRRRLGRHPGQH